MRRNNYSSYFIEEGNMAGWSLIVASIVLIVFRHRIARFFVWMHRNAPGGGGDAYASRSTTKYIVRTALIAFLMGALIVLKGYGLLWFPWE